MLHFLLLCLSHNEGVHKNKTVYLLSRAKDAENDFFTFIFRDANKEMDAKENFSGAQGKSLTNQNREPH